MLRKIFVLLIFLLPTSSLFAQVPINSPYPMGMFSAAPDTFCSSQGGGSSEITITGSNITIYSDIHANGDFAFVPNNTGGGHGVGTITAGDEALVANATWDGEVISNYDIFPLPELVNLDYYNPQGDGRIWNALRNHADGQANFVNGDWNGSIISTGDYPFLDESGSIQTELEGLYYVNGIISARNMLVGAEGITVIAMGQIDISLGGSGSNMGGGFYRSLQQIPATDGKFYPAIFLASAYQTPSCNGSGLAIGLSGALTGNLQGIFYTPSGSMSVSFSPASFEGAFHAGGKLDISASNFTFRYSHLLFNKYDINGDGLISPSDVLYVINRLGQTLTDDNAAADINRDGSITTDDVLDILNELGTSQ